MFFHIYPSKNVWPTTFSDPLSKPLPIIPIPIFPLQSPPPFPHFILRYKVPISVEVLSFLHDYES